MPEKVFLSFDEFKEEIIKRVKFKWDDLAVIKEDCIMLQYDTHHGKCKFTYERLYDKYLETIKLAVYKTVIWMEDIVSPDSYTRR